MRLHCFEAQNIKYTTREINMTIENDDYIPRFCEESPDNDDGPSRCPYCRGTGREYVHCNSYRCPDCNGTGKVADLRRCDHCKDAIAEGDECEIKELKCDLMYAGYGESAVLCFSCWKYILPSLEREAEENASKESNQ